MDVINDGGSSRQIEIEKGKNYAEGIQAKLFETSSKTGHNVGMYAIENCLLFCNTYMIASCIYHSGKLSKFIGGFSSSSEFIHKLNEQLSSMINGELVLRTENIYLV